MLPGGSPEPGPASGAGLLDESESQLVAAAPCRACGLGSGGPSRASWGADQPLCRVALAGTLRAPQTAPWQQGWHPGTPLLPLCPASPAGGGPRPHLTEGCQAGKGSFPCHCQDGI